MSMLFREFYATSPQLRLLQTERKNHLLTIFFTWIDTDSKYLSIAFNIVQFERFSDLFEFLSFLLFSTFSNRTPAVPIRDRAG